MKREGGREKRMIEKREERDKEKEEVERMVKKISWF